MVSTRFPFAHHQNGSQIWENGFESFTEVSQDTSSPPPNKKDPYGYFFEEAETEGFEPSVLLRGRLVSSEVLSTTQPRLQIYNTDFSNLLILAAAVRCLDFLWTTQPCL